MANGSFLEFDANASHHAVVGFLLLGDNLVLPIPAVVVLLVLGAALVLPITRRPLLNR